MLFRSKLLFRKSVEEANPQQMFQAVAYAVKDIVVDDWMDSDCTDEQYMHNFAERYVVQAGVRIATDTPEKFLSDLIRTGYAKEI